MSSRAGNTCACRVHDAKKQAVTVGERGTGCLHKAGSHLHPNKAPPKKKKKKKDDKIDRWNWRKIKMFMVLSPSGSYLWLQMWFISPFSLPFPPHSSPSPYLTAPSCLALSLRLIISAAFFPSHAALLLLLMMFFRSFVCFVFVFFLSCLLLSAQRFDEIWQRPAEGEFRCNRYAIPPVLKRLLA